MARVRRECFVFRVSKLCGEVQGGLPVVVLGSGYTSCSGGRRRLAVLGFGGGEGRGEGRGEGTTTVE